LTFNARKINTWRRPNLKLARLSTSNVADDSFLANRVLRASNWVTHQLDADQKSMGPEILRPESGDTAPTSTQDIEFALVLSRVIDSVRENPEYLRATIYELARYKLKEQFKSESFADVRKLSKSLEIAIQGVEAFKKKEGTEAALPEPEATQEKSLISAHAWRQDVTPVVQPVSPVIGVRVSALANSPAPKRLPRFKAVWRFALTRLAGARHPLPQCGRGLK